MPADLLTGTIVAYGLFGLFASAILYANFPAQFENPGKRAPDVNSSTYLKVALELFSAMIVTGGVVTLRYSGIDFEATELMHWYGYNNVCVVFDDPPASYVCPVYWVMIAYFATRYCIADTARVYSLASASTRMRTAAYIVNCAFVFVACFFAVCLGVGPKGGRARAREARGGASSGRGWRGGGARARARARRIWRAGAAVLTHALLAH